MPIRENLALSLREKCTNLDFWVHLLLFTCLSIAFWPLTKWFAQTAHEQSRIFHALIVLGLAAVFLVRFGSVPINDPLSLNRSASRAIVFTFSLLLIHFCLGFVVEQLPSKVAGITSLGLGALTIAAYCSGIAAGILFLFGEGTKRVAYTVCGTFGAFIMLSMFMDLADWPLRTIAGQWSGNILSLLGRSSELGLLSQEGLPPKLILIVNDYPFHVASECNGFGIILTSLLIAVLLGLYHRLKVPKFLLNLIISIFLGFAFNTLRIVIIVLLAPSMMSHYDLMHEIVGGIAFWGCLILIWLLLKGPIDNEESQT
ncbi:MAG: exosortase/archaeosortase family protein [Verrucomicrobiota bacterium]